MQIDSDRQLVLHVGPVGDVPGGMAQVVNVYTSYNFPRVAVRALCSTKGRRDPLALVRWLITAIRLMAYRLVRQEMRVVVHLSAGGSFVREGSLVLWARLLGARAGVHMHGSRFPSFAKNHPYLSRVVCRSAHSVFVLTDETHDIVTNLLSKTSKTRVVLLGNMVDIPPLSDERMDIVLFAGEVGPRKGVDLLLGAWMDVDSRLRSGWKLILAGPLKIDLSTYSLDDSVEVLGSVPHSEVLQLQSRAKIAALPSRNEALPMFLLESMAAGCAVISTNVGQIQELLSDACGVVIPSGNKDDLTSALSNLLERADNIQLLGINARERIESKYSFEVQSISLEDAWLTMGRERTVDVTY